MWCAKNGILKPYYVFFSLNKQITRYFDLMHGFACGEICDAIFLIIVSIGACEGGWNGGD